MKNATNIEDRQDNHIIVCFVSNIPKPVEEYILDKLKSFRNITILFSTKTSARSLSELVSNADILVGWRPSEKLFSDASKMKLFINPGAGVQQLLELFRKENEKRKVLLINGHGNSYFVAQHAVALLLTLMNKTIPHHQWMQEGKWRTGDGDAVSIPLRFKKIGFLGYGAINQKIHQFLKGFDIEFAILRKNWDRQTTPLPTEADKYEYSQLSEFLKDIEILFVAVPLTSLTKGLLKKDEFDILGQNGLVINVARGEVIDEKSLYDALEENVITGAAIDVWYDYTPKSNEEGRKYPFHFPFHKLDNIILSPHRGYSPFSDLLRWDEVIENIKRMAMGRTDFINVVNLDEEY
ncbi:MAG: NAD(P)-dependent oxidoreductase [Promethearchaeota archaeon]|jgi:phosphoglycerate dehydrogenase-like enzyme